MLNVYFFVQQLTQVHAAVSNPALMQTVITTYWKGKKNHIGKKIYVYIWNN